VATVLQLPVDPLTNTPLCQCKEIPDLVLPRGDPGIRNERLPKFLRRITGSVERPDINHVTNETMMLAKTQAGSTISISEGPTVALNTYPSSNIRTFGGLVDPTILTFTGLFWTFRL
jgi:hypothetical protein